MRENIGRSDALELLSILEEAKEDVVNNRLGSMQESIDDLREFLMGR